MTEYVTTVGRPNAELCMIGDLLPDYGTLCTRHEEKTQLFNFRIDENTDEFMVRIARKADAPPGHTKVSVKIVEGLTKQPDGSTLFDGGYNGCKFAMSFVITHEDEEEPEEEPEEKEIKFFHHPDHKLRLVNELEYTNGLNSEESYNCRACTERIAGSRGRWVYTCPETECDYGVHSACGLLATKIRHPSHPKHVLKLVKVDNPKICDVCKGYINQAGLDYQCAKCDFDMHPLCPELQEEDDVSADEDGTRGEPANEASEQSKAQLSEAQQLVNTHQRNMTELMKMQMETAMVNQMAANMRTMWY